MPSAVRDNPALSRYELDAEGQIAVANYRRADGVITFTHTEVAPELAGRGIGSRLVHGALDAVRAEGLKVASRCTFVSRYLMRHPEFNDLLA